MSIISLPQFDRSKLRNLIQTEYFGEVVIPERMAWTSSSLKLFRRCKRKFFWKYIFGLRPKTPAWALTLGSAFHESLGHWYGSRRSDMEPIATKYLKKYLDPIISSPDIVSQEDYDKIIATYHTFVGMLIGYARVYHQDRQLWHIDRSNVELQFHVDMGEFDFRGKIDLVAHCDEFGWFIVEHKTASKLGSGYIERLPLDTQNRGYLFGAMHLGFHPNTIMYDVVRKCQLRRKKGETADQFNERISLDYEARPSNYFFREPLKFSSQDIDAFEFEVHQTHAEYKAIVRGDFGDPRDPRSWLPTDTTCDEFFKKCEMLEACTNGLGDEAQFRFSKSDVMHAELDETPE